MRPAHPANALTNVDICPQVRFWAYANGLTDPYIKGLAIQPAVRTHAMQDNNEPRLLMYVPSPHSPASSIHEVTVPITAFWFKLLQTTTELSP